MCAPPIGGRVTEHRRCMLQNDDRSDAPGYNRNMTASAALRLLHGYSALPGRAVSSISRSIRTTRLPH